MARRLAAILAADVVGYTRLMESDEVGTLAALNSRRAEVIDPLIAEHGGRIVKLMGDGVCWLSFASVVDAVECAVADPAGHGQTQCRRGGRTRASFSELASTWATLSSKATISTAMA